MRKRKILLHKINIQGKINVNPSKINKNNKKKCKAKKNHMAEPLGAVLDI